MKGLDWIELAEDNPMMGFHE